MEGTELTVQASVVGVTEKKLNNGGSLFIVATDRGVELKSYSKSLGAWLVNKEYTNPVEFKYVVETKEYNGQTYSNNMIKGASGFTGSLENERKGGGKGNWQPRMTPEQDIRCYCAGYVKDMIIADKAKLGDWLKLTDKIAKFIETGSMDGKAPAPKKSEEEKVKEIQAEIRQSLNKNPATPPASDPADFGPDNYEPTEPDMPF